MRKKILILLCLSLTLFAVEPTNKYLDDTKFDFTDLRIFGGLEGGYHYTKASESFDDRSYSYGAYIGIPIDDLEIILKRKISLTNDFELENTSFTLNMPISGTGSRALYLGLIGGKSEVTYGENIKTQYNLLTTTNDGNFYGGHLGKRYKFSENFYVRIELEYLKYNLSSKTTTNENVAIENSLELIYGVEYRF